MINLANESKPKLLDQETSFLNGCHVRLYTNAVTLDGTQVAADFVEPTDSGYVNNQNPSFGAATLNGSNQAEIVSGNVMWTFTLSAGSFSIYGYWLYDPATAKCVYADERLAGPVSILAPGDTFTVTPKKVQDTMP